MHQCSDVDCVTRSVPRAHQAVPSTHAHSKECIAFDMFGCQSAARVRTGFQWAARRAFALPTSHRLPHAHPRQHQHGTSWPSTCFWAAASGSPRRPLCGA